MPTWGQMLQELSQLQKQTMPSAAGPVSPMDALRRKYLKRLSDHTGRAAIVYATAWLENKPNVGGQAMTVNLGDVHGFMEACSNITERELDLIITSPGGDPDAAESIMEYLRTRFDHIRAIIPVAAMSAATMMSLATDEIVMGSHSQLGPIDPQFTIQTPEGPRSSPGQAIIDQFELAKQECQNPANIGAWLPLLRGLTPGLLASCAHARDLAEQFAKASLEEHMFAGEPDAAVKAKAAAAWFSDFSKFRSHGRRVGREDARKQGLNVTNLEDDQVLQDNVLSIYHATRITFANSGAVKIVENHHGRAYIEQVSHQVVQIPNQSTPAAPAPPTVPAPAAPPGSAFGAPGGIAPAGGNRQQRRQQPKKQGR